MSMCSLLVAIFIFVISPVHGDVFYGRGAIYITELNDTESFGLTHRVVYKPEQPDVYTRSQYEAYLNTEISNNHIQWSTFTMMELDEYGKYYYAQTFRSSFTEEDYPLTFAYGVKMLENMKYVYLDELHTHCTLTSNARYCVLDTEQQYDYEYNCSQALADDSFETEICVASSGAIISSVIGLLIVILGCYSLLEATLVDIFFR